MTMQAIFGDPSAHIDTAQACARMAVVFVFGLLLVRLAGRRIFGRWAALDITVAIMLGSNLSRAATGNAAMIPTIAESLLLVALHYMLAHAAARSAWFARLVEGPEIILGRGGKIDEDARKQHGVSRLDIKEALHEKGVEQISETDSIALETSGKLGITTPPRR